MSNTYKVLRDDIDIIHLGKEDDGSLLSLERKCFNFIPEIGEMVNVFQNEDNYIVYREIIVNEETEIDFVKQDITNPEQSTKKKMTAGLLALFFGGWAIHSLYLNTENAFLRLVFGLSLTVANWGLLFNYNDSMASLFLTTTLISMIYGIWCFIEAILILTSGKGSKWHKDGEGKELID